MPRHHIWAKLYGSQKHLNLAWIVFTIALHSIDVRASNDSAVCDGDVYPARTDAISWFSSNAKVLNIGTALTLNSSSTYGNLGKHMAQAYTLWFDWLNERHGGIDVNGEKYYVKLHLVDDSSDREKVVEATRYLLHEKNIDLFLGPYGSTLTGAAAAILNESGAVMVCGSASSTSVFKDRPRMFGLLAPAYKNLEPYFEMLSTIDSEIPPKTVAYLYEDQPFTRGVCGPVDSLAEVHGFSVVFGSNSEGQFHHDDMGENVNRLMAKVFRTNADVLIGCVYEYVCKFILESAKKLNYDPRAILFTVCVTSDNYRDINGDNGGYVMGVAPWTREVQVLSSFTQFSVQEFVELYESTYRSRIPYQAVAAFASAAALTQGVLNAQTVNDTEKIAQAIRDLNQDSEFGLIAFDENGQGKNPYKVVQAKADSMPVVAPEEVASAFPSYPKPPFDSMLCLNTNPLDPGRYGLALNGSCLPCNNTEVAPYEPELGYRVCRKKICPPGHCSLIVSNFDSSNSNESIWGAYCPKCFPGYYASTSGFTQCEACEVGRYQRNAGATACVVCPAGRHSGSMAARSCQKCNNGRYSDKQGSSRCLTCPIGSFCSQDPEAAVVEYTNANGYFLFNSEDQELPQLIPCQHGEDGSACVQGGICHVDENTQEPAMEGPFCGKCREGYGRSSDIALCQKCPDTHMLIFYVFLQGFFIFLFGAAVFTMIMWTDLSKPKNLAAVVLRQCMNYMGMSTVVFQICSFRLPIKMGAITDAAHFLRLMFGTSSPSFVAHAGNCAAASLGNPYKVYVVLGLVWVPAWILFLAIGFRFVGGYQQYRGKGRHPNTRLITLIIVNLFVVHPRDTELCLTVFNCKYFDTPRLMMDTTVDCHSNELLLWQMLGLLGFLLYALGIPLGVFMLLRFHKNGKGKQSIHSNRTIRTLGFLYSGFEPEHYYFECVFMLRKVLYQLVILIPPMASSSQEHDRGIKCLSMLFLAVLFLAIHMWCLPYDNRSYFALDRIEAASLWAILITLLTQSWIIISDQASVFKKSSILEEDRDHARNRDIRDACAAIVVFFFHARFIFLVIYLTSRPVLLWITRWKFFDHGFVEVGPDGLLLVNADTKGRRLFCTMFQELVDLIVECKEGQVCYDELRDSLEYIVATARYHRAKEAYELGTSEIDDEIAHYSILESFTNHYLLQAMLGRAWQAFNRHVGKQIESSVEQATHVFDIATGDDVRHGQKNKSANVAQIAKQLSTMRKFNTDSVNATHGRHFYIEELHLAMVRIQREVVKGRIPRNKAKTKFGKAKTKFGSLTMRRASVGRGSTRSSKNRQSARVSVVIDTLRSALSTGPHVSDELCDQVRSIRSCFSIESDIMQVEKSDDLPPDMSHLCLLEKLHRDASNKLANLQARNTLVRNEHKLEMITHELILRQLHHDIRQTHGHAFSCEWYEASSSEDDVEEVAILEKGEHIGDWNLESNNDLDRVQTKYLRAWQLELKNILIPQIKLDFELSHLPDMEADEHTGIEDVIEQEIRDDLDLQAALEPETITEIMERTKAKEDLLEKKQATSGVRMSFDCATDGAQPELSRSTLVSNRSMSVSGMICANCDAEQRKFSNFCHNCGQARPGKEKVRQVSTISSHKMDMFMEFQQQRTRNEELKDSRFKINLRILAAENHLKEQTSELQKVNEVIASLRAKAPITEEIAV